MILDILRCQCTECDCHKEFDSISGEELLNVIQHGRLNPKQIEFTKTGLDAVADPEVSVDGSTVTVEETDDSGNVVAYVIAGYDFTEDGLCPTEVYDIVVV